MKITSLGKAGGRNIRPLPGAGARGQPVAERRVRRSRPARLHDLVQRHPSRRLAPHRRRESPLARDRRSIRSADALLQCRARRVDLGARAIHARVRRRRPADPFQRAGGRYLRTETGRRRHAPPERIPGRAAPNRARRHGPSGYYQVNGNDCREGRTHISTEFVNLGPDEIDACIQHALQTVGEFAGVDRSYVFLLSGDGTTMDKAHEWCAEGIESFIDKLNLLFLIRLVITLSGSYLNARDLWLSMLPYLGRCLADFRFGLWSGYLHSRGLDLALLVSGRAGALHSRDICHAGICVVAGVLKSVFCATCGHVVIL